MKKQRVPSLVSLAILTMITTFCWIGFSVYRAITSKPAAVVPPAVLEPLNPNLDTKLLTELRQRFYVDESQLPQTQYLPASTPSPLLLPAATPTASPSATLQPEPTGEATP